jgi:hypothetical protein
MNTTPVGQNKCKHGVSHPEGHQACDGCCTRNTTPANEWREEVEIAMDEFDRKFLMDMSWINRPDFPLPVQIWLRTTLTALLDTERARLVKEISEMKGVYSADDAIIKAIDIIKNPSQP